MMKLRSGTKVRPMNGDLTKEEIKSDRTKNEDSTSSIRMDDEDSQTTPFSHAETNNDSSMVLDSAASQAENEIEMILELCMADEREFKAFECDEDELMLKAYDGNDENPRTPHVVAKYHPLSENMQADAMMNVLTERKDSIWNRNDDGPTIATATTTTTTMVLSPVGSFFVPISFNDENPDLDHHMNSAFSPFFPVDSSPESSTQPRTWTCPSSACSSLTTAMPVLCQRCEYFRERGHFLIQLKKLLDESSNEFNCWSMNGQSFFLVDHPLTISVLAVAQVIGTNTQKMKKRTIQRLCRRLYTYGFIRKSRSNYFHPNFQRESTFQDVVYVIEQKRTNKENMGVSLHCSECPVRHMNTARFGDDDSLSSSDTSGNAHALIIPTPLSAFDPTKDTSLDEIIAEVIFDVYGDGSPVARTM